MGSLNKRGFILSISWLLQTSVRFFAYQGSIESSLWLIQSWCSSVPTTLFKTLIYSLRKCFLISFVCIGFTFYNVLGIQIFLVNVEKLWKDRAFFFFFFPRSEAMTPGDLGHFMSKSLPTSLIQISSRCKSLSAGQGVWRLGSGLPCQEKVSAGPGAAQLSLYLWSLWKAAEKSFALRWATEGRYFVLIGGGVWSHQHETQHTPAGRRGGAAPAAGWRFGSRSAPPCFMRTWPPFIYVFT